MHDPAAADRRPFHLVETLDAIPAALTGGVVAIGNFDGVHRGHQAVLAEALDRGQAAGRPVLAMTFEPHPRTVFRPDQPVFRLTPPGPKARLMRALGLDGLLVVPFDRAFASIEADAFVSDILLGRLGITDAVVGYDFHFGRARGGSPAFLAARGARDGFSVEIVEAFADEGAEPVSSSRIRDALAAGDLGLAQGLLGYRWFVEAEVVHGEKRGRELGFPTANMRLGPDCRLRHGIYAVTVAVGAAVHQGVASYGRRPQFDNGAPLLETYLLDFAGDLYGRTAVVTFVSWLRPEQRFDGVEALVAQMHRDTAEARAVLGAVGPGTALDRALGEDP
ncbi:bifunctional riboflavin kinase/FAD synthetase [Prosthecomicrobium sp. N25]|uniref:bifunctional riboflavin kinase/FAD synthetase n=1 Tax=Prosthecomicrobium sp. N25 TaxID=3129254 RepID=UPI003077AAE8